MNVNEKLRSVGMCVVVLTLVASACSSGDGDATGSTDSTDSTSELQAGGDLVYAIEAESTGGFCLPEAQLSESGMRVVRSIYDPLTTPTESGDYAPYLLESIEPNDTVDSFTLKLREGVTFHDGTALDSTVLKNNIDAWIGRYPARPSLLFSIALEPIDTVEVLDDLTVEVTTKVPWPALPAYLNGGGRLGIMAQAQLDDPETCDRELIGTGPFMLDEWRVNESLSASRNPDYWATDEKGNQLPYLDSIAFVPVPDGQTRVNGLLSGEYDAVMTSQAESTEALEAESESGGVDLTQSTTDTQVANLMLNESKAPFDDPQARQAAILAVDRDLYRELVGLGLTEMASGPFPPDAPGYLADAGYPEHDLERATELVSDYEQRTGSALEFSYLHGSDPNSTQVAQFIQGQLEAAGMKVNLQAREQAALINEALGTNWEMMWTRNFPGGVPDRNHVWWYSSSPVNFPRTNDAEIDSMLDAARSELDEQTAVSTYEDINRRLNEQFHYLWLDWVLWAVATQPTIGGVYGPVLPSGDEPSDSLTAGHPTLGLHYTE